MGNSELFECEGPLDGRARPHDWERWDCFARCRYLASDLMVAGDLLEAMEILKAAGQWPEEEPEFFRPASEQEALHDSEPPEKILKRQREELERNAGKLGGWAAGYDNYS